jgi:hypothetical protein
MTDEQERPFRNIGKSGMIAARKKIKTMLAAGYDRKYIHTALKEAGIFTMSYSTFCVQFNKFKAAEDDLNSDGPHLVVPGKKPPFKPETTPGNRASKSVHFSIDRSRPAEDLM